MIIDYRHGRNVPRGPVCVTDARTGEEVRFVFYIDTETHQLGRHLKNEDGSYYVDPAEPGRAAQVWETRPVVVMPADNAGAPLLAESR